MGRRTTGVVIGIAATLFTLTFFVLFVLTNAVCSVRNTSGSFGE